MTELIITEENVSLGKKLRIRFILKDVYRAEVIGGFSLDHATWWMIRDIFNSHKLPWWKRLFFKPKINVEVKLANEYIKERDSE